MTPDGEHRDEDALIAAALARADHVADGDLSQRQQPSSAHTLHGAEHDELGHGLRQSGQYRADEKDADRRVEQRPAAVLVAELAVERRRHRGGDDVGRHHPGQMRDRPEIADDARQSGDDDVLIESAQRQHQDQSGEQPADVCGWFGPCRFGGREGGCDRCVHAGGSRARWVHLDVFRHGSVR
jgi:hypothetical protein